MSIIADNLTCSFGSFKAVDNISLRVNQGEIYALIGPNGAGKTTLIKMLVGLLPTTSGKATVGSFGYLPDNPTAYDYLTGYEFLELTGSLNSLDPKYITSQIKKLSKIFPLSEVLKSQMGNYSRGNRQKVGFLSCLMSPHKALIIDEPIVGLDPTSIVTFGHCLQDFAAHGGAVLMATHTLAFAKQYATRVGIVSRGKLVQERTVSTSNLENLYTKYAQD